MIRILNPRILRANFKYVRNIHHDTIMRNDNIECAEEVQIPVPWGHVSGKWWGPKDVRPILGLHGWQDNAGTFDTLAPLLPKHVGLLSIDLPGHGFSSRLPDGMFYSAIDNIHVIRTIMKEYNWEKVSIMAHSMSSIIGFIFAGLFPDKIDMLIGLDALKPHIRPVSSIPKTLAKRFENFLIADERNRSKEEPPSYLYEECIEKLHIGTFKSVDRDKCPHLLDRNIQKSSKYPDKYFFTRDSRMKCYNYGTFFQDLCLDVAKRITTPYCFIKANSSPYYEDEKYFHETVEVLKQNPHFYLHRVDGTHHVHLNEPEKVSGIINDFINKYRKPEGLHQAKL